MTAVATAPSFSETFDQLQEQHAVREAVRLVPAAGEPIGDEAPDLRIIRDYLERFAGDADRLAKAIEAKPAVVSLLLSDPQRIPVGQRATLVRAARAWIDCQTRARALASRPVVDTAVVRAIVNGARLAYETKTVVLIGGPPGCGKSAAVPAVLADLPGVVAFRADCDSRGGRGALRALGQAASGLAALPPRVGVKVAIGLLRGGTGLVTVDEGQGLSVAGLEALRSAVVDGAGCGLLLLGTSALCETIDDHTDGLLGPFMTRIAVRVNLAAGLLKSGRWLPADELGAILGKQGLQDVEPEALRALVDMANTAPGLIRRAVNAARVAAALGRGADDNGPARITAELVAKAGRLGGLG